MSDPSASLWWTGTLCCHRKGEVLDTLMIVNTYILVVRGLVSLGDLACNFVLWTRDLACPMVALS